MKWLRRYIDSKRQIANDAAIEQKKEEILRAINNGGGYLVPNGFEVEEARTSLHQAFRSLISEKRIVRSGYQGGFDVWTLPHV